MRRRRRYQMIVGAVTATLLVAGAVSHAPAARQLLRPVAASLRVVVPPEVKPTDEVYALVDDLLVRAGAKWRPVGVLEAPGVADGDGDNRDVPWRRVPSVGGRPRGLTMLPVAPMRAEPVTFVHTKPAPATRDLPPLKAARGVVVIGPAMPSRPSAPRSSPRAPEPVVGTVPNSPAGEVSPPATLPPELLPPEQLPPELLPPELLPPVVGGVPTGEAVPVPEPMGVSLAAALCATALVRRRRRR